MPGTPLLFTCTPTALPVGRPTNGLAGLLKICSFSNSSYCAPLGATSQMPRYWSPLGTRISSRTSRVVTSVLDSATLIGYPVTVVSIEMNPLWEYPKVLSWPGVSELAIRKLPLALSQVTVTCPGGSPGRP